MRVDVFDDAARLRLRQTPIQCGTTADRSYVTKRVTPAGSDHRQFAARECDDCSCDFLSCQCRPGEG